MPGSPSDASGPRGGLHPRNRHAAPYDFAVLIRACPALAGFVRPGPAGRDTIDFADPAAVMTLNRALLAAAYGVTGWEIPAGYLCPPVPGRADYVHRLADLLADGSAEIPRGPSVAILDLGVGANCIYPLIGASEYGWRFVGTEIDTVALNSARRIVAANPALADRITLRRQSAPNALLAGVVTPGETFAASMCNPPFHPSAAAADAGTRRKLRNLAGGRAAALRRNFGGQAAELWCDGGESGFVRRLIAESARRPGLCGWFTTLVSNRDSLPSIRAALARVQVADVRTIPLVHGQKQTRIVAWRFERRGPAER